MKLFSQAEIKFLFENYPKYGSAYCAEKLCRSKPTIIQKARALKLSAKDYYPHASLQKNFDINIISVPTKEFAYFLGFMWADGHVSFTHKNSCLNKRKGHYRISLEIARADFENVNHLFEPFVKFAQYHRKRRETWKETTCGSINNKYLYEFLFSLGFEERSRGPYKVKEYLPEHLFDFFILGFFDGDGHTDYKRTVSWSGSYDTDWTVLINMCHNIQLRYHVDKRINKKTGHKCSAFTIRHMIDVAKFINHFIRPNHNFGLLRKRKIINQENAESTAPETCPVSE